ncbi:MAG: hypothetical protein P1V13_06725 [Rhizobiaceae bacterium]|nr:hypothetical protein [Rhizobiaceae bacterium]
MTDHLQKEVKRETGEGTDLWRVILAPTIWAVHFLVCYVAAAIYCEKAGRMADLLPVRLIVGTATFIALAGLAAVFISLWKVRGLSSVNDDYNYAGNTPEERHRFLSHVALMLCVLSGVAILYAAFPALVLEVCR